MISFNTYINDDRVRVRKTVEGFYFLNFFI